MINTLRFQKNEDCDVQICDPFEITEDMIKRMEDKLKLVSKDGQITIIEDKRHDGRVNCAFCHTTPCHFSRHIEEKHSEEPIVSNTIKHPKGSKERKRGWTKIRNSFSFLHNKAVLERGTGGLMVQYVSQNKDPSHLKVCPFCYGLYANLQIHVKRCGSSPQLTSKKVRKAVLNSAPSYDLFISWKYPMSIQHYHKKFMADVLFVRIQFLLYR